MKGLLLIFNLTLKIITYLSCNNFKLNIENKQKEISIFYVYKNQLNVIK